MSIGIVEMCQKELCSQCEEKCAGVIDGYWTWIDEHSGYGDDESGEPNVWASESRARYEYLPGHCDKVNYWLKTLLTCDDCDRYFVATIEQGLSTLAFCPECQETCGLIDSHLVDDSDPCLDDERIRMDGDAYTDRYA